MGFPGMKESPLPELPSRVHINFDTKGHLVFYLPKGQSRRGYKAGERVQILRSELEALYAESVSLDIGDIV